MNDTSELEALKARLKELETAQAPAPAAGWGGLFSLVGSVVALVPRWLVVAAGVVFVAWLGFDLYANVQMKMAEVERVQAESRAVAGSAADVELGTAEANRQATTSTMGGPKASAAPTPSPAPSSVPVAPISDQGNFWQREGAWWQRGLALGALSVFAFFVTGGRRVWLGFLGCGVVGIMVDVGIHAVNGTATAAAWAGLWIVPHLLMVAALLYVLERFVWGTAKQKAAQ
jgi:hypothetical protein